MGTGILIVLAVALIGSIIAMLVSETARDITLASTKFDKKNTEQH